MPSVVTQTTGDAIAFRCGRRRRHQHVVVEIVHELPRVDRMRLLNVDDIELHTIAILAIELVERGHRPAEWRSSVAPEHQHHRPTAPVRGEGHSSGKPAPRQREIRRSGAGNQFAAPSPRPHRETGSTVIRPPAHVFMNGRIAPAAAASPAARRQRRSDSRPPVRELQRESTARRSSVILGSAERPADDAISPVC